MRFMSAFGRIGAAWPGKLTMKLPSLLPTSAQQPLHPLTASCGGGTGAMCAEGAGGMAVRFSSSVVRILSRDSRVLAFFMLDTASCKVGRKTNLTKHRHAGRQTGMQADRVRILSRDTQVLAFFALDTARAMRSPQRTHALRAGPALPDAVQHRGARQKAVLRQTRCSCFCN